MKKYIITLALALGVLYAQKPYAQLIVGTYIDSLIIMDIKFGSVCSGIEAASVAWNPLGFSASWLSGIEKFPAELLAYRYPRVKNIGAIMKADRKSGG